jgi:hypothetical protein
MLFALETSECYSMLSKIRSALAHSWFPLSVCVVIVEWQSMIAARPTTIDPKYGQFSMSGAYHTDKFVYFEYYLGLFPVTSELFIKKIRTPGGPGGNLAIPEGILEIPDADFSEQAAKDLVAQEGQSLLMDFNAAIMNGARLKTFLYLPNAIWTGTAKNPSYELVNSFFFRVVLIAVFLFLWRARYRVLAVIAVLLLGSYPFQLVEVYTRTDSIFGWLITSCLGLLALNGPILLGKNVPRRGVAAAILSGIWLGTMLQVRFEIVTLALGPLLVYLVHPTFVPRFKIVLAGLLIGTTLATQLAWNAYLERKYNQAIQVVRSAGGHPYEGPRRDVHVFWHAIWCGLGDFDNKYGYQWNDLAAYAYAEPILEKKYHLKIPERDSYYYLEYWDAAGKYPKKPEHFPEYNQVIRDKVLSDIAHDPRWYLTILVKRIRQVLTEVPPLQVHLGFVNESITLPGGVWLALGLVMPVVLLYLRRWDLLKLMIFCLPLMAPPLLIFSKGGMYYSIHHLLSVAILVTLLAEWIGGVATASQWNWRVRRG